MVRPITFGTSGWRGIIADEFTFERSRALVAAIAQHLKETGDASRGVLVAHDPRFLAEEFSAAAAEELASRGIDVLLAKGPAPTPAVSCLVIRRRLGAAINFTASHNPAAYQGLKLSPSWGGPALPETTRRVEELALKNLQDGPLPAGPVRGTIVPVDPAPEYLAALAVIVDRRVLSAGRPLAYDALFGAGAGYLDRFLEEAGCRVTVLNARREVTFGGSAPEPSAERLGPLSEVCRRERCVGLSTDGDADRFGVVGEDGRFVPANEVLALLAHYLLSERKMDGHLARSVATTHLLDRVAAAFGRECRETPVGFKYIGEMISRGELAMGGEESAGMSVRGHVPEKDGILACLLVAEMSARRGRTLAELRAELEGLYGPRHSRRLNLELHGGLADRLRGLLASPPRQVGGVESREVQRTDGVRWLFDGEDWALLRMSGTEPVARLYLESPDLARLESLERAFRAWVLGTGD